MQTSRRSVLASLMAGFIVDPESLLHVPGKKKIFIPKYKQKLNLFSISNTIGRRFDKYFDGIPHQYVFGDFEIVEVSDNPKSKLFDKQYPYSVKVIQWS